MDLNPYVEALQRDLAAVAAASSAEAQRAADLLAGALEPATRLALLDAMSQLAAEVTDALDGPTVEVRLQSREPQVVVTQAAAEPAPEPAPPAAEEAGNARITLRLPESVKSRLEGAAAAENVSVNTWLVRAITRALDGRPGHTGFNPRDGRRITGYARG
jgi:predicted HicB family RNase H-like nuclease